MWRGARVDGDLWSVSSLQLDRPALTSPIQGCAARRTDGCHERTQRSRLQPRPRKVNAIRILRTYGEEEVRTAYIARLVIRRRDGPITRTGELVDIIREAAGRAATGGNRQRFRRSFAGDVFV